LRVPIGKEKTVWRAPCRYGMSPKGRYKEGPESSEVSSLGKLIRISFSKSLMENLRSVLKEYKELTEKGRYLRIRVPYRRKIWLNTNQLSANGDTASEGTR
jgi:hypothetical protein